MAQKFKCYYETQFSFWRENSNCSLFQALFPQSESTDYTIKGKQPLEVTGPRLHSQKEHKISKTPLYMKDSRFCVKVVEKQPKLSVDWSPPESMFQGEIQALDLVLKNVGNASMTSLTLAHFCPGMFSFETSKKKTLFDFPLIPGKLGGFRAKIQTRNIKISQTLNQMLDINFSRENSTVVFSQLKLKSLFWHDNSNSMTS